MFRNAFSKGMRFIPEILRSKKKAEDVGWKNPYYAVTLLDADLVNERLHPNTGAPDYNVKHEFSDLTSKDHNLLDGLSDDDHTQYILEDGTRDFTGDQAFGGFNITGLGDIALDSITAADGTGPIVVNDDLSIVEKFFIEDNSYWDSEVPANFLDDSTATESYIKGQIKIDAGNGNTPLALYADNGGAPLGADYFAIYDTSNPGNPNKLFRVQRGASSAAASVTIAGNQTTFLNLGVHKIKADVNPNIFEIESGATFDMVLDAGGGGTTDLQIYAQTVDVAAVILAKDKIAFTQTDFNEYIDSLIDGELDIEATTSVNVRINGTEQVQFFDGSVKPTTDDDVDLGSSANRFKDIFSSNEISNPKMKFTSIGGLAILLTNKTGDDTVAGQLVKTDTAADDAVILTGSNDDECYGVFLDSGVADNSEAWVVVSGIADVSFDDDVAAVHGNWVGTGAAGYARTQAAPPALGIAAHFEEIGHSIESVAAGGGGTHILARCVLHFN